MRYPGKDVEALKAVAKAHEDRSLSSFETVLQTYKSGKSHFLSSPRLPHFVIKD